MAGLTVDSTPLPRSEAPRPSSYADIVEKARLSVVSVYPATLVKAAEGGDKAFLERYFGRGAGEDNDGDGGADRDGDSREEKGKGGESRRSHGHGSGVIVGADGLILTNNHVVRTPQDSLADEILVELHNGRRYPAKIIGTDPLTDIALLKMEPVPEGPALSIADSGAVRVGDLVFAIGNPFDVGMTVTMGCVSATGRGGLRMNGPGSYEDFIQTDAAINHGNSGGALIDTAGRLIGINTAIRNAGGGGNVGIGFAVPSRLAVWVADQLRATGQVRRGRLGLDAVTSKPTAETPAGVKLTGVESGGAAERAGFKTGDILTAIDGVPVISESGLRLRISLFTPGTGGQATVRRGGETLMLPFITDAAPDDGGDGPVEVLPGITLAVSTDPKGLKILAVAPDSPGAGRLSAGQVITEINTRPVDTPGAARSALRPGVNQIRTVRDGKTGITTLRLP